MRLPAGVLVLLSAFAAPAAGPPPLPRNLTAGEQKEVAAIQARLDRHYVAGELAQAARLAEQIAAFRTQRQGARHWQAIDANFAAARWQRLVKVPAGDRAAIVRARVLDREAATLMATGRYREAETPLREILGEKHPFTATGYGNVSSCLDNQGKHAEALDLARRGLAIHLEVFGEEHPDTARSYSRVADCLAVQGKHAEALPLHRRALALLRKTLGEGHPETANSYNNLALCLEQQGKHPCRAPGWRRLPWRRCCRERRCWWAVMPASRRWRSWRPPASSRASACCTWPRTARPTRCARWTRR
jgi:tetratricopeptide (TPR) repeat protein